MSSQIIVSVLLFVALGFIFGFALGTKMSSEYGANKMVGLKANRVSRSYPCGFPGCLYVAETKPRFVNHIITQHGAYIERRRSKKRLRSNKARGGSG